MGSNVASSISQHTGAPGVQRTGHHYYKYTADLCALEGVAKLLRPSHQVDLRLRPVTTPLKVNEWARLLTNHPDTAFVDYILAGIKEGFRIGYKSRNKLRSASRNMRSALEHPQVVQKYLDAEVHAGRVLGPFDPREIKVHTSRFGVIPKKHQPGKWRLILDLSHPENHSVNAGISSELCSLTYLKLDEVAEAVVTFGRGAQLAKVDVASAYRIVPVNPADRHLLGMRWKGKIYVDAALSFGLRSAPKIFTALADAATWGLRSLGIRYVDHYLDDWITIGSPGSSECEENCALMTATFDRLGCPLAQDKTEGPTTCLEYLGIEIDTVALEMRLPPHKLERLRTTLQEWQGRKCCTKRDLQSLTGLLQHAATVVRPGRTFMRRMCDLLKLTSKPGHHIRLNKGFRSDLAWWSTFAAEWNGVSVMSSMVRTPPENTITSDASGSWGCGSYWSGRWFQLEWVPQWRDKPIAQKELLPIVIACAIWGANWRGEAVVARSDNTAAVAVINSRSSRDPELMHLLRCLFFFEARHSFRLEAAHIPGKDNVLADNLSRNRASSFLLKVPTAQSSPSLIPSQLLDLLMVRQPDWTSADWTALFSTISNRV